jgi:hypothetical protein
MMETSLLTRWEWTYQGRRGMEIEPVTKPTCYPTLEPERSEFEPCDLCQGEGCPGCDFGGLTRIEEGAEGWRDSITPEVMA